MNLPKLHCELPREIVQCPAVRAALVHLLEADRLARSLGRTAADFAIEFLDLIRFGSSAPALKSLVAIQLVRHHTAGRKLSRMLEFSEESRFSLTDQGRRSGPEIVRDGLTTKGNSRARKPRWDESILELWFDGRLVKRLSRRATNQIAVLSEFQRMGWPPRITYDLPGAAGDLQKRRANTIQRLNRDQIEYVLLFHLDGDGVRWESALTE